MNTTTILLNEHRVIEQVLNCLERIVDRCESHRPLESGPARDVVAFLRGFIERCHDKVVDTQLLPTMCAEGITPERCLGCSLHQRREECRFHLDRMEAAIERASEGNTAALKKFREHAQAYIELMLDFIASQEDCVFPMIAQAEREADNARQTDCEGEDPCSCDTYVDVANRLADHFGVLRAVLADSAGNQSVNRGSQ